MTDVVIQETCSCGATFRANGTTYRSQAGGGTNSHHRGVEEMAERWRTDHRHDMPPLFPELHDPSIDTEENQ